MLPDPAIATAADYADALLTARRAKNLIVLILLVLVLAQLAMFFSARYWIDIRPGSQSQLVSSVDSSSTQPTVSDARRVDLLHYANGVIVFVGLTLSIVLSLVVLLLVKIMLVGRLIGVSRAMSAFIWSLVLVVLLFPWQAFLMNSDFTSREFIIPGVLFTWDELTLNARFATSDLAPSILKWARFVGFPVLAIVLLLAIQVKSNRGLAQALGESDDRHPAN
jgi:hypothetical protein